MSTATGPRPRPSSEGPRRRVVGALSVLLATLLAVTGVLATSGVATADGADGIESVPVEFTVRVENQAVPCDPLTLAGGTATIRGTLTGPTKALEQHTVVGSVLSHGDGYDESFWTFPDEEYNVVTDLAKRGHVSVSYDRLGYGDSDKPNGNGICYGTEATVLKQITDQLRAGTYRAEWSSKPAFSRLAVVGHSASGFIVEQMAGFLGGADALGAISTGLEAATPTVLLRATQQQQRCLIGPNEGNGYAGLEANDAEFRADHIFNVEPRIADILTRNRTKDACAGTRNLQSVAANTAANLVNVTVPVLAVAGANDAFFPNVQAHAATFTASPKVTVKQIPQTGHAIAFSRNAALFRNTLEAWLTENKL